MQSTPRCFGCHLAVEHDPIYEAPCGHDDHASAIFHPLCLMEWRERRDQAVQAFRAYVEHLQKSGEESEQ